LLRALSVLSNNGDFVRMDSIKRVLGLRRGQLTPFEQAYFEYASADCTTDAECLRATGTMMRMNIDDGDIFIGEFDNGGIGSIQTSFVTVGNYPGIEARVYGSKGALICRLVEENGICETLKGATADSVEFKELEIPQRFYPAGGSARESWRSLFYANLIGSFISEIRGEVEGNEGNFEDGAHVQELINAVERSFRERRWVNIPLEQPPVAGSAS
jgi:predicted dehydrogenase